ncbi:uncharacterized protein CIMG_03724 [Coccidioides immitis RS]|uniref:Uncharacterized protein n=1 Tax=Coccidioides immitis (strain RS) TaxID=246410 RepID=A0A0E1RYE3_COCIM|nr:uncharacterized protein CIMG_03724 [Coccidioides immitis RS]EAS32700.2 hypothetical protein CIMG_03724 [Coccidioides immitis RS]
MGDQARGVWGKKKGSGEELWCPTVTRKGQNRTAGGQGQDRNSRPRHGEEGGKSLALPVDSRWTFTTTGQEGKVDATAPWVLGPVDCGERWRALELPLARTRGGGCGERFPTPAIPCGMLWAGTKKWAVAATLDRRHGGVCLSRPENHPQGPPP